MNEKKPKEFWVCRDCIDTLRHMADDIRCNGRHHLSRTDFSVYMRCKQTPTCYNQPKRVRQADGYLERILEDVNGIKKDIERMANQ